MGQTEKKPTRKERKKARKDLAALLRRLRRWCRSMDQVSDWYDLAKDVEAVVNDNSRAIPAAQRRRLQEAMKLPEATMAGMGRACRVLQSEVGKTAAAVGGGATLAGAVGTVVLLTAVVVLAATVAANQFAVNVHIFNHGCGPIDTMEAPFADSPLLSLAGLNLPPGAIFSGGDGVIAVPPLRLEADNATNPDMLTIRGPGQVQLISLPVGGAAEILFNGQSLLGVRQSINLANLGGAEEHILEVICGR